MHTMRTSLVLTNSDFVVALDSETNKLHVVSLADLANKKEYVGLVRVWLGPTASLAPLLNVIEQEQDAVMCNDEKLYGIVPLVLPCEIRYKNQHMLIDEYLQHGYRRSSNDSEDFQLYYRSKDDAE